jgi:hypothetical protein
VQGTINGEISPGTYADFMAAALRKDFVAVSALTGLTLTVAASGSNWTITRSTGSFLTAGIKAGDVVRITAGSVNALNLNKNVLILDVTSATIILVKTLNGSAMFAESSIASCTITMPGKKTWAPTTGHTNKSYSIEHFYSDIVQSEVFTGCQPSTLDLQLPASGLATIGIGIMGQGVTAAASQYFTSPTAATTTGLAAAVNGVLAIDGTPYATLTGLTMNVQSNRSGDPVVGSNVVPTLFPGRILVSGQATAYFDSVTLRDAFLNETEFELILALSTDNTATANFITFALPRVKANGHTLNDGEGGLVATIPFQALLPSAGGSGFSNELTTIAIHDSSAP